ncbi:tyrosine-type recombinase/integrase [Kitasatospora sp. NPDC057223]|uniref:tyrosine-type recombinase/integrase n=1 Tax=Kitasatospora sp. NPDC057223 TaxID=3346055 RepID=UPI0036435F15
MRLPSGVRYWTVVDENYAVVPEADAFLQHVRFGRDQAELTTKTYAGHIALFLRWCARTGRDWRVAAEEFGLFLVWLKFGSKETTGIDWPTGPGLVLPGPGAASARQPARVQNIATGVRQFLLHGITTKAVPSIVMAQLFEVAEDWELPVEARGEGSTGYRMRPRHRVKVPRKKGERATDREIVALFLAAHNARDRFIVLLLGRAGLRPGGAAGLRREDMHFMPDSTPLGCPKQGSHLHTLRRDNANGAWAKRQPEVAPGRWKPVDHLVVQAYDQYVLERIALPHGLVSDFVLVNLFAAPLGAPMTADAITELLGRLSKRAGLERNVTPRMLRRAMGSNLGDAGAGLDEVSVLLDHARLASSEPYLTPAPDRLRSAVEAVPSPRELEGPR